MARTIPARFINHWNEKGSALGRAYLGEAVGMSTYDGDIAWLRIDIVQRRILFDSKIQDILLLVRSCSWVFSDMLTRNGVFFYLEKV